MLPPDRDHTRHFHGHVWKRTPRSPIWRIYRDGQLVGTCTSHGDRPSYTLVAYDVTCTSINFAHAKTQFGQIAPITAP